MSAKSITRMKSKNCVILFLEMAKMCIVYVKVSTYRMKAIYKKSSLPLTN